MKDKNTFLIKLIFSIIYLFKFSLSDLIHPDQVNPLMIKNPNRAIGGQTFIFRFSLSPNSLGLTYNQVIGIDFPDYPQMGSIFFENYENLFTCSLTDYSGNSYLVTPIKSEGNSFACQYIDNSKNLLASNNYVLTIGVATNIIFSLYPRISCLNLFTASSGNLDKIFIDSNPCFADMALYPNYLDQSNASILEVMDIKTNPIEKVAVYSYIDLIIQLKTNDEIEFDGKMIVIKFPGSFGIPLTANSTDTDSIGNLASSSFAILGKNLNIEQIQTDKSIFISGINKNLIVPQGKFIQITLGNIYVGDNSMLNQKLEVYLYYKNTYSIISYDFIEKINIVPVPLNEVSIGHPDNFDTYDNIVAPLKFDFNITNPKISSGYVVIRHENINLVKTKLNFISSTCDFSKTNFFSQNFGERPYCFPLRNTLEYSLKTEDLTKSPIGSAIVFKLPQINNNYQQILTVSFTVFAYNEICGNDAKMKTNDNNSKFSFSIKIYKILDMTKFNENRFIESDIIASTATNVFMSHTCYSSVDVLNQAQYETNPDTLLIADIFDFRFASIFNNNSQTGYSTFNKVDFSSIDNNLYAKGYFANPENKNLIINSYLAILTKLTEMTDNLKKFNQYIAIPSRSFSNYNTYLKSQMKIYFSRNFLQNGDSNCYFSWAAVGPTSPLQTNLLLNSNDFTTETQKNFIVSDGSKLNGFDISSNILISDDINTKLPLQINSKLEDGTNFKFLADALNASTNNGAYLMLYSNCFKFKNNFNYKSIYDYFEMSVTFFNEDRSVVRVNRFFKFMGNAGLIDENQTFPGEVVFHTFTNSKDKSISENLNFYNNGICMIEIKIDKIKNSYRNYSNKLIVNISNMLLIDIDYTDVSTTYPNNNNIIAYSNPSFPVSLGIRDYSLPANTISKTILYDNYTEFIFGNSDTPFQLLGSSVIFSIDYSNINNMKDILIPTFCPVFEQNNNTDLYIPSLSIYWATMNDFSSTKINSIIIKQTDSKNYNYFTMQSNLYKSKLIHQTISFPIYTSIKFNQYFSQNENKIYILPNAPTSDNIKPAAIEGYTCTAFSLLISEKIRISSDTNPILSLFNTVPAYFYKGEFSKGKIYFYGIPFKSMLFAKTDSEFYMNNFKSDSKLENAIYFTGVKRPLVTDFYDPANKTYNYLNLIAFQCTSNGINISTASNYFANYDFFTPIDDANLKNKYFILDSNTDTTTTWALSSFASDKPSDSNYKNDYGSNMRLTLKTPNQIDLPSSFFFRIDSPYFTSNTICGINNNSSVPVKTLPCNLTYNSGTNIYNTECQNPSFSQDILICCYNIKIELDKLAFPTINVVYKSPKTIPNYENYVFTSQISVVPLSGSDYSTGNSNGQDLLSATQSGNKFNNIQYTLATQENSFGKANLSITLAREIVRGSQLIIYGDLSKLQIHPNLKPKCAVLIAGFSDYVESCNLDFPIGNVITIKFQKNIYTCGINLPKNINILIWPVKLFTYTTSNSPLFSITMQTSTNRMLVNSNGKATLNFSGNALSNIVNLYQEDLCNIDIFPYIPGEISDYTFTFDLTKNGINIPSSVVINEALIYFPYQLFHQKITILEALKCRYRQMNLNTLNLTNYVDINCSLFDDNFLIASFPSALDLSLGFPQIQIIGIPNSFNNENFYFACTLNNYIEAGRKRTQIINGTGKFNKKLTDIDDSNTGGLELFELTTDNVTPGDSGKITIKVRFDSLISNSPTSLSRNTFFITYIPNEYDTKFYNSNSAVKGKLSEFYVDNKQGIFIEKPYNISSQDFLGNRLMFKISNETIISDTFSHWEIYLEGLINPVLPIETTGRFRIAITNMFSEFIYKTFTNTGSLSISLIPIPVDDFLKYTKGLKYFYSNSQKKWQLEFFSNEYINLTKNLYVKKGRFVKYVIRTNINNQYDPNLVHTTTQISLKDGIISSDMAIYNFSTAKGYLEFYIGLPCTAVIPTVGNYYINIGISNLERFYKLNPFIITVDDKVGTIMIPSPIIDTIRAGMQFINFSLSDPTFASFTISFSPGDGAKNDASSTLDSVIFLPMQTSKTAIFKITSQTAMGFQIFQINNPNLCFALSSSSIMINVNAEKNDIPSNFALENYLTFANSDMDPSLNKNSIRISFTPPVAPLFLYCALVCYNRDYPSNDQLINPGTNYDNSDPLIQFNSQFIPVSFGRFDLIFNDLIRGMTYKLKCLSTTSEAQISKTITVQLETMKKYRKKVYVNTKIFFDTEFVYEKNINGMEKLYDKADVFPTTDDVEFEEIDAQLKVSDNVSTHCIRIGSNNVISQASKDSLLNYCQRQFINYLGCTICIDDDKKVMPGMEFSKNLTCFNNTVLSNSTNLRNLQSLNDYIYENYFFNNGIKKSTYYYTLCAIQDLKCNYDIDYPMKYSEIILKMINNLKDIPSAKNTLNVYDLMFNSISIYYDKNPIDILFLKNRITQRSYDISGKFTIKLNPDYNTNITSIIYEMDLICYWKVDKNTNPPFYLSIVNCKDNPLCGSIRIYNTPVVITNTDKKMYLTLDVTTYNLWLVCLNNIPNPTKPTSVISLDQFTISPETRLLENNIQVDPIDRKKLDVNSKVEKEKSLFEYVEEEKNYNIPNFIEEVSLVENGKDVNLF